MTRRPMPPGQVWERHSYKNTFGVERRTNLLENWPDGKRVAVLLSFDPDVDIQAARPGFSMTMHEDGSVNYGAVLESQYGIRYGIPRILSILRDHGVKATFPTPGATVEWYPDIVRQIARDGHEIASHSYWHFDLHTISAEQVRQEIKDCTEVIEEVAGTRPVGWRTGRYAITPQLLDDLIEFGYQWQSDIPNDDVPFFLERAGGSLLQIPIGVDDWNMNLLASTNDRLHMGGVPYTSPEHFYSIMECEFKVLYRESSEQPRIFQVCFHPEITGQPSRAWALTKIIEYCLSRPGVWFTTFSEITRLCR